MTCTYSKDSQKDLQKLQTPHDNHDITYKCTGGKCHSSTQQETQLMKVSSNKICCTT